MKTRNASILVALLLAVGLAVTVAHASEADQATQFTFDQDVRIPGVVLPAGTYWFVLLDTPSTKNIVRVYNFDRSELITTVMTNSAERLKMPDNTRLTFTQPADDAEPATLLTWYYPGRTIGHQFTYSYALQSELDQEDRVTMQVNENGPVYIRVRPAPESDAYSSY
jgi:Protein of unknown function (DUF2911)